MERLPAPLLPPWLDAMVPFDRYSVRVEGHRLHVMETGEGRPVVMLHGNPTWGFLYRKVASALSGQPLRLIMPDLVGLGFSDKPRDPEAHQLDHHIRWIGALIDGLDLQGALFVGQDWGGPIGLGAFAERKERLSGMVILNTVIGPPRPGFRATAFHRFARMPLISDLAFRGLGFPQIALHLAQGDKNSIRGKVARAYRAPLSSFADRVAPLALARMVPDSHDHPSIPPLERCFQLVSKFTGPAAIVWGKRDPVLGSVLGHVRRTLPDAPVTETGAGHFLQEEVPDEIAAAIKDVAGRIA